MTGIEVRGRLVFAQDLSIDELWFVAKNIHEPHAEQLARVWSASKKYGCTYAPDVMDRVKEMERRASQTALPIISK